MSRKHQFYLKTALFHSRYISKRFCFSQQQAKGIHVSFMPTTLESPGWCYHSFSGHLVRFPPQAISSLLLRPWLGPSRDQKSSSPFSCPRQILQINVASVQVEVHRCSRGCFSVLIPPKNLEQDTTTKHNSHLFQVWIPGINSIRDVRAFDLK